MDQLKIYKYLSGEASPEEKYEILQWINASSENRKDFIHFKQLRALTQYSTDDPDEAWKRLKQDKRLARKSSRFIFSLLKYAAIAIIFLSIGIFTSQYKLSTPENVSLYKEQTQFEVPFGQMSKITLPDGTLVSLNSGSKLTYKNDFSSGKRDIELTGEAFFDVKTDKEHPFTINTSGAINIRVFGTSFNVRAYPEDEEINATLVNGSVSVIDNQGNELTKLVPGENAKYSNSSRKILVSQVDTDFYTSWKDGMVTFRNESLGQIALKIERWYNVKIIIENEKLANELYNGTIMKNKPIDQILEVFRVTSSLKYQIIPRTDKPTLIYWK